MRTFSFVILFFVSRLAFGQEPIRKANTIVVESSDSASVIYKNLKRLLLDNGFALVTSDNDVMSITARAPVPMNNTGEMTIDLYVKPGNPNQVIIRGMFDSDSSTIKNRIEYTKWASKWSKDKISWKKMDEFAKAYPGGEISYQVQDARQPLSDKEVLPWIGLGFGALIIFLIGSHK
jgi:hypothetical protein